MRKTAEERDGDALADLLMLRRRLADEKETELLAKIAVCQEPLNLRCEICQTTVEIKQRCKRKWCPCCVRHLAGQRSAELQFIVERMQWPLFVTLTMRNVEDLSSGGVRHLRRAFGKLRHRRFWKDRVKGGIANVEVTNIGNGWHPHLHCVIDCRWLAIETKPPRARDSQAEKQAAFKSAAAELERHWAKCLKQETASVKVKRAFRGTITKEVVKYSVKSSDLIECAGSVGDVIRALESTRLMTTFGKCHGQCVKDLRADAKRAAKEKWYSEIEEREPRCPCGEEQFMPEAIVVNRNLRNMDGLELGRFYKEVDRIRANRVK